MNKRDILALSAGAILLVGVTAGASAYVMKMDEKPVRVSTVATSAPTPQPQRIVSCSDDNIVGKLVGGVAGGLVGNEIGNGHGRTAATIGGSVGGTILGERYIPTNNVTCR